MAAKHGKAGQQAARSARLAAALRENLRRRKAQTRDRARRRAQEQRVQDEEEPVSSGQNQSDAPDFRRNPGSD